jgi:hypothetical protein
MYGCDMDNPPTTIDNLAIATLACKYGWADEGSCARLFGVDWSEDDSLTDALAKASCDCSGTLRVLPTASLSYELALSEDGGPYEPLATIQEEDWVDNTYTPLFDHAILNARVRMRVFDGGTQVGEAYTGARDVGQLASVPPAVANGLHLDGSVPNPSRGSTTISFTLPVGGRVSLEIVDIAGRRIATLVDRTMEAGPHHYVWDGRGAEGGVPPGVYLCRLRQGDAVDARTIIRCR